MNTKQTAMRADFQPDCVKAVEKELQLTFQKHHRSLYESDDKTTAIVCAVSKDYQKPSFRYWYSFQPYQADFLNKHNFGFLVLGGGTSKIICLHSRICG
jgi:hypothetical protein